MLARNKALVVSSGLALLAFLGACDDDVTEPDGITRDDIIRSYAAVTFTTTANGETTDRLAEGVTLDITLHEDGTTTGRLFAPGGGEGGDFDVSLAGTFSFDDGSNRVTFDHEGDTFVQDMPFTAVQSGGSVQLEGEHVFSGTTFRVVLR